ncbi:PRC-barrel domain-containing protein [uncultured Bacteroides sp.]|uniref:PRC-barrel domain-containing protein n=1 Tax=uncultured Bacteroides sp. TaxID=162156 RepID=UPI002AABC41B|nr:PRC-barrel domain-containing protein [uncultured Bacteroides sp.]
MLISVKKLNGYKLNSLDGEIGKAKEFYFDDKYWTIRYLVADTGGWLTGRKVLISPYSLIRVDKEAEHIDVDLTKKQIEDSPLLESDKPVSLQFEESYYGYYGSPMYWAGSYMWGYYPYILRERERWEKSTKEERTWDPHLRSTYNVDGYYIQASNGEIGHVEDFIINDETWEIVYLVIDTKNWWPGKKVLVSPRWMEQVSFDESKLVVNLSREAIKEAPEYVEESLLTREYELKLHEYYNQKGYWSNETVAE